MNRRSQAKSSGSVPRGLIRKCASRFARQIFVFLRETGLHGCKYISESHRPMVERAAWAMIVVASVCTALGMVKVAAEYYSRYSFLSVIESTRHGIWNYPFPAVTVCNFNRVSIKLSREFVNNLTLPSTVSKEFVVQEMKLLYELLYPGRYGSQVRNNLSYLQNIFDMNGVSIPTVMNAVSGSCQSLLGSCKWKAKKRDCRSIFRPSLTRDGICCSFNYITHDAVMEQPNIKPYNTISCGYQSGLNILFNFDPSDYSPSNIKSFGTQIMLHSPYNYPDHGAPSKLVDMNKYSFLTVQPTVTLAANIRGVRGKDCVFYNETDKIVANTPNWVLATARYSMLNCLTNCRATTILKKCGCVPYYYPRNHVRFRTCNLRDSECLETYKYWYDTSSPGVDMSQKVLPFLDSDIERNPCNCISDCEFYHYSAEYSAGDLDERIYHDDLTYTMNPKEGKAWENQSIAHVLFGDLVSIKYHRDMRYNWRHNFATFGGLLGVFAGINFLTMFEIIYFCIVRVLTDACRKWRGE